MNPQFLIILLRALLGNQSTDQPPAQRPGESLYGEANLRRFGPDPLMQGAPPPSFVAQPDSTFNYQHLPEPRQPRNAPPLDPGSLMELLNMLGKPGSSRQ